MPKMRNPATGGQQGFEIVVSLPARDNREATLPHPENQHARAAQRLALRFGLTIPVARAVVELAGIGGAHG